MDTIRCEKKLRTLNVKKYLLKIQTDISKIFID